MKQHTHCKKPVGPNSPTAHAQAKKALRRDHLLARIKELEAQVAAANGETRRNLRERFARVTGELAEAQKLLKKAEELQESTRLENLRIHDILRRNKINSITGMPEAQGEVT
jgi:hypothetical protein